LKKNDSIRLDSQVNNYLPNDGIEENVGTIEKLEKTIISLNYEFNIERNIYTVSVGNLLLEVPSEYVIRVFDGNLYKLHNITEHILEKVFNITIFDKNSDYRSDTLYDLEFLQRLENHINYDVPFDWRGAYRINIINNIKMFDELILSQHEPSATFSRILIFFDDTYCYQVQIWYAGQHIKMPHEMPEYFDEDNFGNFWWNNNISELNNSFKEFGSLPEYLTILIDNSNYILNSFRFK
jgi:hypothetical protein